MTMGLCMSLRLIANDTRKLNESEDWRFIHDELRHNYS